MFRSRIECLESIGIEGTLERNSDELNDEESVREGNPGALSGAGRQTLN